MFSIITSSNSFFYSAVKQEPVNSRYTVKEHIEKRDGDVVLSVDGHLWVECEVSKLLIGDDLCVEFERV